MADHDVVLLDTSVVIAPPPNLPQITARGAISVLTVAELASGLSASTDPVETARRQARYERVVRDYSPIAYTASAARLYGALCTAERQRDRNPRARRFDLMLASVAGDLGIPLLTRNPDDFRDIHEIVRVVEVSDAR